MDLQPTTEIIILDCLPPEPGAIVPPSTAATKDPRPMKPKTPLDRERARHVATRAKGNEAAAAHRAEVKALKQKLAAAEILTPAKLSDAFNAGSRATLRKLYGACDDMENIWLTDLLLNPQKHGTADAATVAAREKIYMRALRLFESRGGRLDISDRCNAEAAE